MTHRSINSNRFAVLILAHKEPEQLRHLVNSIDDNRFDIFIHIDKKKNITEFKKHVNASKSGLFWVEDRVATFLNDFSLVEATCRLLKRATEQGRYKYYILLTGQDYPIKPIDYIAEQLYNSYPTCWIDSYPCQTGNDTNPNWTINIGNRRYSQRLRRVSQRLVGNKFYHSPAGKLAKIHIKIYDALSNIFCTSPRIKITQLGYRYCAGSHFFMLPDTAVDYLLNRFVNENKLNRIFQHIPAAEESYFQTVIDSMPGAVIPNASRQFAPGHAPIDEMDNPSLRLIKWFDENGEHTSGHPAIFSYKDFDLIKNANALFARKFDTTVDNQIIDMINEHILFNK